MYSRPPNKMNARINIPENYGGNAFGAVNSLTPRYSDPKDEGFSDISPREEIASAPPSTSDTLQDYTKERPEDTYESEALPVATATQEKKSSSLSSLLPNFFGSGSHFPFAHGIGSEEMLILAMMAMIFMSEGETDNELLLLLGLLLFAG